jgi:hypothetical protein
MQGEAQGGRWKKQECSSSALRTCRRIFFICLLGGDLLTLEPVFSRRFVVPLLSGFATTWWIYGLD